jgi:hypothetical protein
VNTVCNAHLRRAMLECRTCKLRGCHPTPQNYHGLASYRHRTHIYVLCQGNASRRRMRIPAENDTVSKMCLTRPERGFAGKFHNDGTLSSLVSGR